MKLLKTCIERQNYLKKFLFNKYSKNITKILTKITEFLEVHILLYEIKKN